MRLLTTTSIQNDNYVFLFSIDPTSVSIEDTTAFQKYGVQNINFGCTTVGTYVLGGGFNPGSILTYASYLATGAGVSTGSDAITLPDNYFALPTAFPVQISFSVQTTQFATNTQTRLTAYQNYIQFQVWNTLNYASTGLRAVSLADQFTGSFITNI